MRWLILLILATALAGSTYDSPRDAHERADGVLWPTLVAGLNIWSETHMRGFNDKGHFDKLDSADHARLERIRSDFKAWNDAMKQAGY